MKTFGEVKAYAVLTTIEPVLAACATLNRVFCGFGLVTDGTFAYGRHVTER